MPRLTCGPLCGVDRRASARVPLPVGRGPINDDVIRRPFLLAYIGAHPSPDGRPASGIIEAQSRKARSVKLRRRRHPAGICPVICPRHRHVRPMTTLITEPTEPRVPPERRCNPGISVERGLAAARDASAHIDPSTLRRVPGQGWPRRRAGRRPESFDRQRHQSRRVTLLSGRR